jgi:hypothetical protein
MKEMTETEYLASQDFDNLMNFLRKHFKAANKEEAWFDRKFGFVSLACFRRELHRTTRKEAHEDTANLALLLDGKEVTFSQESVREDSLKHPEHAAFAMRVDLPVEEATAVWQAQVARSVFGNPFQEILLDKNWLQRESGLVVSQAAAIYNEEDWRGYGTLGDAFEDVGCTDRRIMDWCRGRVKCCCDGGLVTVEVGEQKEKKAVQCPACDGAGFGPVFRVKGDWLIEMILGR